jgi:hypothetical protein
MNMPMLKSYVELAVKSLPWERVGAIVGSLILQAAQSKSPEVLARAKRYIAKAKAQLVLLDAALADDRISTEEARAVMDAWADGAPTPIDIETKAGV